MPSQSRNVNPTVVLTGAELTNIVRNAWGKPQLAVLIADLREQSVVLVDLTPAQLAALVEISITYAYAAMRLTPSERLSVRIGDRPLIQPKANGKAETETRVNGHGNGHLPNFADAVGEVIRMFGAETVAAAALDAMPAVEAAE